MDASDDILFNASALHSLKRQQLIVLCKRYKVKASGKNDDIVARLQAYGQSLTKDTKSSSTASTQDSTGCYSISKSDEAPEAETGADASADTTPNTTIRVPGLTLHTSLKDVTDLQRPSQRWEVVVGDGDEAEFGELKAAGSAGSVSSNSTAPCALTIGNVSSKPTKSSATKGSVISSGIMSIAKSIKSVASKTSFKSSSSQPVVSAHHVPAQTTGPSAKIYGSALTREEQGSALDTATDERRDSLSRPIVESKVDAASAGNGDATIRLVALTTPTSGAPLVGEQPVITRETIMEATEERPMDVDLSSTGFTSPVTKPTKPPACVFGSPTAGISNTQFGNAAALVLEEMNRRLGVSSGGAKISEDGGKVEFGILPDLNVDVSKTLESRAVKKDEGRFGRAHEKEFAKMDSIANHYSLRRPLEKVAGKKRKSMEGASHHDTLVPLKDDSAKDAPTTKRQKTGDAPPLRRKASTSSLAAKGNAPPPKSQGRGVPSKKIQRDRDRRRSSRGIGVGSVRGPFVSGRTMSKPGVAANTSGKLGLLRSGAARIRSMLGSTSTATPVRATSVATTPAPTRTKAKEMATTCLPPTSTEIPAAMKDKITPTELTGRKTPGPASRTNTGVSKASSSSSAAQSTAQPTSSALCTRRAAILPTTSQVPSASAAGMGVIKHSASNTKQRDRPDRPDKAETPSSTEPLTVKRPTVALCTQVLTLPASAGVVVSSPKKKKTVRTTPHSQRTSRLYAPTASSLARMAATNAKYRTGGVSTFGLDIVLESTNSLSPTKTTDGFKSLTPASTIPTHALPPIVPKTTHEPLSRTPANTSPAVEADGVSPIPAPPAHLSKTNSLIPRKTRSPLSQANRPHISRSKIIAKVEEQRVAAAAGASNPPGTPGNMLRKSVAVGAGAAAKASAMGETLQEHKSARVQEAFERRVRLSEAAIRRCRIGQMPIV